MDQLEYTLVKLMAIVLSIIFGFVLASCRKERIRNKKKEQHRKSIEFENDKRPPILYLRSFSTDGIKDVSMPLRLGFKVQVPIDSFEMKLDEHVSILGPFLAIGNPEKAEKEIGAVRKNFSNEEWKTAVLKSMKESSIIIYRPSLSRSTIWEFAQLIRNKFLSKTIITVRKEETYEYEKFREVIKPWLPNLPQISSDEMYICINGESNMTYHKDIRETPLFIKLRKQIDD